MLAYYARFFDCLEINFTFYRFPTKNQLNAMIQTTRGTVEFVIKAHQSLTHERDHDCRSQCQEFAKHLIPGHDQGLLGAILLQFPFSFHNTPENRQYLELLRDNLKRFPLIVEFRHESWIAADVFSFLRHHELGFCCVDGPNLPGLIDRRAELTSSLGYVRFHGRNADKWFKHEHAWERYHYLYQAHELVEWVGPIKKLDAGAKRVYLFANNHYNGHAATNAIMLQDLLGVKQTKNRPHSLQLSLLD